MLMNKKSLLGLGAALVIGGGMISAHAATQVVQVRASVDTSLSVVDLTGAWSSPIIMAANTAGDALEKKDLVLQFHANDYKDVVVTLQSTPVLTDTVKNKSIPLSFKVGGTALAKDTPVTLVKTSLYEVDAQQAITGFKDVNFSIESANVGNLESGNYSGTFTFDFSLAP
ncbi:hypothetical protein VXM60_15565 [Shewanella khirikhana]|uniref:hypothetical protein n=1 Tax=Shewanella khirikhana TaxID=1965282 RepID=UPI0030D21863